MSYTSSFKFFRTLFSTLLLAVALAACATQDDDNPWWLLQISDAQDKIDNLRTTVIRDQHLIAKLDEAQQNLNQAKTYYQISDSFNDKSAQLSNAKFRESVNVVYANQDRAFRKHLIQNDLSSGKIKQEEADEKKNLAHNIADSRIAMSEHERKKLDVKIAEADRLYKERNSTASDYLAKANELIEYVELTSIAYRDANGEDNGGGDGGDGNGDDD